MRSTSLITNAILLLTSASSAFASTQSAQIGELLSPQEFTLQSEETHPIMESQPYNTTCYRTVTNLETVCRLEPVRGTQQVCENVPEQTCFTPPHGRPQCHTVIARRCHTEAGPITFERRCGLEMVSRQQAYGCVKEHLVQVGTALDYNVSARVLVSAQKVGEVQLGVELRNQFELSLNGQNLSSRIIEVADQNNLVVLSKNETFARVVGDKQKQVGGQIELKLSDAAVLRSLSDQGISRIRYENDQVLFATASGLNSDLAVVRLMVKRDRIFGGDTILFDGQVPASALTLTQMGGESQGKIDLRPLIDGGLNSGRHRIELSIEPLGNLTKSGFSVIQGNSLGELPKLETALKLKL